MLNKFKFFFYSLMVSAAMMACSGEDGDPGPQGEQGEQGPEGEQGPQGSPGTPGVSAAYKTGFFEGTVSGKRKDGTAFNEAFKYEYTFNEIQSFDIEDGQKYLNLSRYLYPSGNGSSILLSLKELSEGVFTTESEYSAQFEFEKELNNDDIFMINARPYFAATEAYVGELKRELNSIYRFSWTGENNIYYNSDSYKGTSSYAFSAYLNNVGHDVHYDVATGSLLGIYNNQTGNAIESGSLFDLYNKLKFKYNATLDMYVFYDAVTGEGVYVDMPDVPADQLTITNYARNATTGVITFDFVLKISGHISSSNRENTTGNDLTITGKYNSGGKVYKNIVAREQD